MQINLRKSDIPSKTKSTTLQETKLSTFWEGIQQQAHTLGIEQTHGERDECLTQLLTVYHQYVYFEGLSANCCHVSIY